MAPESTRAVLTRTRRLTAMPDSESMRNEGSKANPNSLDASPGPLAARPGPGEDERVRTRNLTRPSPPGQLPAAPPPPGRRVSQRSEELGKLKFVLRLHGQPEWSCGAVAWLVFPELMRC